MTPNQKAFLDTIAHSEGTSTIVGSDNGYNVEVGNNLFHSYTDHPNVLVKLNDHLSSTAAGRYQFTHATWVDLKAKLHLPDFSPNSQDMAALELVRECHASDDVLNGNFISAIEKCAHIWASFPGAGYGQHENKVAMLQSYYSQAGGVIA